MKSRILTFVAALSLSLSGCPKHSDKEYDDLAARATTMEQELAGIRSERERLTTENGQMRTRLGELGQNVEALTASDRDLQAQLAELQRRERLAQERLATFRNMLARFRELTSSGRLRVRVFRGKMIVELPAGILFQSGEAELKTAGQAVLTEVAGVLKLIENRDFLVAGHTDNVRLGRGGKFKDNWELSAQRAVVVLRYLQEAGLPAEHLAAAGYADAQPIEPNQSNEANRAKNRRVEIILMPNLDELPDLSTLEGETPTTPPQTPNPTP